VLGFPFTLVPLIVWVPPDILRVPLFVKFPVTEALYVKISKVVPEPIVKEPLTVRLLVASLMVVPLNSRLT
jgi:hypothetical protein